MQRLCDWVKGRSINVSYIYIYIHKRVSHTMIRLACFRNSFDNNLFEGNDNLVSRDWVDIVRIQTKTGMVVTVTTQPVREDENTYRLDQVPSIVLISTIFVFIILIYLFFWKHVYCQFINLRTTIKILY